MLIGLQWVASSHWKFGLWQSDHNIQLIAQWQTANMNAGSKHGGFSAIPVSTNMHG